eukprot:UN14415
MEKRNPYSDNYAVEIGVKGSLYASEATIEGKAELLAILKVNIKGEYESRKDMSYQWYHTVNDEFVPP